MILDHLKIQTTALHKETEQDNLARFILDHSISTAQYINLLRQNFYAYAAIDQLLAHNASMIPDYLKRFADASKSNALKLDLEQLDQQPKLPSFQTKSLSAEQLLGMLYVIEGSMLGGLLIRKNLESCFKLDEGLNHHFFGKNVQEVMQRWQDFKSAVSDHDYTSQERDQAVTGAHLAFGIFKKSYALI